jgi:hypothetical protein
MKDKKHKIYISCPMKNNPNYIVQMKQAKDRLEKTGLFVAVNPMQIIADYQIQHPLGKIDEYYCLLIDLSIMKDFSGAYFCNNFSASYGCKVEYANAEFLKSRNPEYLIFHADTFEEQIKEMGNDNN